MVWFHLSTKLNCTDNISFISLYRISTERTFRPSVYTQDFLDMAPNKKFKNEHIGDEVRPYATKIKRHIRYKILIFFSIF